MKRLRLWRVRRSYRRIVKIETRLRDSLEAANLRRDFIADSFTLVRRSHLLQGLNRGQRRAWMRKVLNEGTKSA